MLRVYNVPFSIIYGITQIVSASQAGDIQFLDVRRAAEPYLTIEAHMGSLTALSVHRHAPVVASGSAKQMIKVFSLEGEQLLPAIIYGAKNRQCELPFFPPVQITLGCWCW